VVLKFKISRALILYVLEDMKLYMRKFVDIAFLVRLKVVKSIPWNKISLVLIHLMLNVSMTAMNIQSVKDVKLRLDQVKVVAVTCLGITSPLLANKRFDVCIMDEAGQTTLPVCFLSCLCVLLYL
jgi:hypothetical protein